MRVRWLCLIPLALVPLVLTPGCGGKGRPIAATGVVMWDDGTPISGATINFMTDAEGAKGASGFSGSDGKFELTTFSSGDGALPGTYAVIVTKQSAEPEAVPGDGGEKGELLAKKMKEHYEKFRGKKKSEIPAAYTNPKTTPLKATVQSGEDNHFTFKISKKV